jgi:hypothetical protein
VSEFDALFKEDKTSKKEEEVKNNEPKEPL